MNENMALNLTPEAFFKRGYKFPFEGEKHDATIVEIPYRHDVWRCYATPALKEYFEVIKSIAQFEHVIVCVSPKVPNIDSIKRELKGVDSEVVVLPYDDAWARDNTPMFLVDYKGYLGACNFGFNAWGGTFNGLYSSWEDDNKFGERFFEKRLAINHLDYKSFILEGGSIHTNGKGTLITTEECLLSKGRNPTKTKEEIEETLKKTLNQKKVLWLPYGIYKDETTGHVDNIACFLDETHVLLAWTEDEEDPQYLRSYKDYEYLIEQTTADGKPIEVLKMPLPGPLYETEKEAEGIEKKEGSKDRYTNSRLAGSYVNFYMGKDFIILPKFNDKKDEEAYKILNDFYKGSKKIIQIYSREILLGGGNIHCITKQIPYGKE